MSKKQIDLFEIPAELPKPERKKLPQKPRELTFKERMEDLREKRQQEKEEKLRAREAAVQEAKRNRPTLEQLEQELSRARRQRRSLSICRNICICLMCLLAVMLLAALIFPAARVQGEDMMPTLQEGDMIVSARSKNVQKGDLVLFSIGGEQLMVRRMIAAAGDQVDISEEGIISVNGEALSEEYVSELQRGECDIEFPCTVPEGRIFVLSDNRSSDTDSRFNFTGMIAEEQIVGSIIFRLYPFERAGAVE